MMSHAITNSNRQPPYYASFELSSDRISCLDDRLDSSDSLCDSYTKDFKAFGDTRTVIWSSIA